MTRKEYITLCLQLLVHCYLYYEEAEPTLLDHDYDQLYRKLVTYEYDNTAVPFSPTQFVGFDHRLLSYHSEGSDLNGDAT